MLQSLFAFLAVFVLLSNGPAQAQLLPTPVQSQDPGGAEGGPSIPIPAERPSGFEAAAAQLAAAERYRSSCRDIRNLSEGKGLPANSTLRDFSGSTAFIEAITEFCAYGDFVLRGQPRGQACEPNKRMRLDRQQYIFLSSLNKISDRPIGRLNLECVETDSRLYLEHFETTSLRIVNSRFESLVIFGGRYSLGIDVMDKTELPQGIIMVNSSVNGSVRLLDSTIGTHPNFKVAMAVAGTDLRNLNLERSTINGPVDLQSQKIDGDMRLESLTVNGFFRPNRATITGHFSIRESKLNGDFFGYGVNVAKDFVITNTTIDGKLETNRASVGTLFEFRGTTVTGDTQMRFMQVATISFAAKTAFKGGVQLDYAKVGPQFLINDVDFEKDTTFSHANVEGLMLLTNVRAKANITVTYARMLSYLEINNSQIGGLLNADNLRTGGNLWFNRIEVTGTANIRFAEVGGRVYMNLSKFESGLYMNRLRAGILELRNSETPKDAQFTGMVAREVLIFGFRAKGELFLGNSRLNVLAISYATVSEKVNEKENVDKRIESEFGLLDCSDCVIDQYALLGGKMTRGVRLAGTRVNSSLNFSEGSTRASWEKDAVLDLTGVQVQVIQADDSDLRVVGGDDKCPNQLVEARLSGVKFDSLVGGRLMDMKISGPARAGLFDRPVTALKEWMLSKPSCWSGKLGEEFQHPAASHVRFDPQPFEVFAAALDRSGRPEAATELRILKRDEEVQVYDYSLLRRAALVIGKWVVSYGYENENALFWFALLWLLGIGVYLYAFQPKPATKTGTPQRWYALDNLGYAAFYSLDRAVPQLTLDKSMDRYSLVHPGARYYFYLHRVLGACILIYAVAGLTGVLK